MPDVTTAMTAQIWEWIKYIWIAFIGLFVWNGKRVISRIDVLEKNTIDKETFNNTLRALRTDIKDIGKDVRTDISAIHGRIDKLVDK